MLTRMTRAAPYLLALGLLTWVLGITAAQVHEFRVLHVVCAEHGEVIELAGQPQVGALYDVQEHVRDATPEPHHDHGCTLVHAGFYDGSAHAGVVIPLPQVIDASVLERAGDVHPAALLGYAPKTSPPHTRA